MPYYGKNICSSCLKLKKIRNKSLNLCNACYTQFTRYGDPNHTTKKPKAIHTCAIDGCERTADRIHPTDPEKRICQIHIERWQKHGQFESVLPLTHGNEVNRKYKPKKCVNCTEERKIAAKGLCRRCYSYEKRNGKPRPMGEVKRKKSICIIDVCDKYVVSNGLCDKHRKRLARHNDVNKARPHDWGEREKHPLYKYWCDLINKLVFPTCEEWLDDFWQFVSDVKERPENHYLRPLNVNKELSGKNFYWVKPLTPKELEEKREERKKTYTQKKPLKITPKERSDIYKKAKNLCQICGNPEMQIEKITGNTKRLAIDHCHTTGKIRGALCSGCNTALGRFKDDPKILEKAIKYLKENG